MSQRPKHELLVLAYHKVCLEDEKNRTWFHVTDSTLRLQLEQLLSTDWRAVTLDELTRGLRCHGSLPARCALVTFDDGCRCLLDLAMPVVRQLGVPSVVFVPVAYVGGLNLFDQGIEPEEEICSWNELEALQTAGMSVQSHGMTHTAFSSLPSEQRLSELSDSKSQIEDHLGNRVTAFAYPYGDPGGVPAEAAHLLRQAGYSTAFLYGGGEATIPGLDPFGIQRVPMSEETDLLSILA